MALKMVNDRLMVATGRYTGWPLSEAIKYGTHGGLEKLEFHCDYHGEGEIFRAERDRQNPLQFVAGCIKCGHSTPHTVEHGCTVCAAYKGRLNDGTAS